MSRHASSRRPNGWGIAGSWVAVAALYLFGYQRLATAELWSFGTATAPLLFLYVVVIGLAILSPILLLLWASARWLRSRD